MGTGKSKSHGGDSGSSTTEDTWHPNLQAGIGTRQMRVLVFQGSRTAGNTLLFDSARESVNSESPSTAPASSGAGGGPAPRGANSRTPPVRKGAPAFSQELVGELMFGAVPMAIKGKNSKIHFFPAHNQLLITNLFDLKLPVEIFEWVDENLMGRQHRKPHHDHHPPSDVKPPDPAATTETGPAAQTSAATDSGPTLRGEENHGHRSVGGGGLEERRFFSADHLADQAPSSSSSSSSAAGARSGDAGQTAPEEGGRQQPPRRTVAFGTPVQVATTASPGDAPSNQKGGHQGVLVKGAPLPGRSGAGPSGHYQGLRQRSQSFTMTSTGTLKDCEENIRKNEELRELILNSSHLTSAQPVTCRTPFGVVLVIQFPNPKAVAAEAEAARERRKRSFGSRKRHQEDEVVGGDEECEAQHFMDFLLEHIMQVDMMMGKMVASCLRQLHVQGARNVVTAIRQGMECWSFNMFSVSMSQFCLQQSPSLHRSASEFMNSIVYFSRAQRLRHPLWMLATGILPPNELASPQSALSRFSQALSRVELKLEKSGHSSLLTTSLTALLAFHKTWMLPHISAEKMHNLVRPHAVKTHVTSPTGAQFLELHGVVFKRLFYDPHKKGDEGAEEPGSQASPNTSLTADTVSIASSSEDEIDSSDEEESLSTKHSPLTTLSQRIPKRLLGEAGRKVHGEASSGTPSSSSGGGAFKPVTSEVSPSSNLRQSEPREDAHSPTEQAGEEKSSKDQPHSDASGEASDSNWPRNRMEYTREQSMFSPHTPIPGMQAISATSPFGWKVPLISNFTGLKSVVDFARMPRDEYRSAIKELSQYHWKYECSAPLLVVVVSKEDPEIALDMLTLFSYFLRCSAVREKNEEILEDVLHVVNEGEQSAVESIPQELAHMVSPQCAGVTMLQSTASSCAQQDMPVGYTLIGGYNESYCSGLVLQAVKQLPAFDPIVNDLRQFGKRQLLDCHVLNPSRANCLVVDLDFHTAEVLSVDLRPQAQATPPSSGIPSDVVIRSPVPSAFLSKIILEIKQLDELSFGHRVLSEFLEEKLTDLFAMTLSFDDLMHTSGIMAGCAPGMQLTVEDVLGVLGMGSSDMFYLEHASDLFRSDRHLPGRV